MIDRYFSAPKTLRRLHDGLSGPYIDAFAEALTRDSYAHATVVRYLRAAAHLGVFLRRRHKTLADLDAAMVGAFRRHLRRCQCPASNGGRIGHHAPFGVQRFQAYLIERGLCPRPTMSDAPPSLPTLIGEFTGWYQTHRGVAPRRCGSIRAAPRRCSTPSEPMSGPGRRRPCARFCWRPSPAVARRRRRS